MPKFQLHYHKIPKINDSFMNNETSTSDEYQPYAIQKFQHYNPLYNELFHLDKKTYNKITLNQRYQIVDINSVYDNSLNITLDKNIFIKFSPLLDPIRYMVGKYDEQMSYIHNLPGLLDNSMNVPSKYLDVNNVSYTDNFFCYLSSQMLHTHHFVHSLDYYGSFLAIQNKYKIEISDDLEYLQDSKYFNSNLNKLFTITSTDNAFYNFASRANKKRLQINNTPKHNITCHSLPELDIDVVSEEISSTDDCNLIYELDPTNKKSKANDDSSDDSSVDDSDIESSNDDDNDDDSHSDGDSETDNTDINIGKCIEESSLNDENWETDSSYSSFEESESFAFINNYPVQGICIEKCKGTIDDLFETEQMSSNEGICALFQIIMTLLCYQKCFHFTHNDLHTNNIMYIETDKEFLYYQFKKQVYKLPTYGKIYKIIDFGRSIYKFNGRIYCSDSFAPGGDASTQYNCEPYFNANKTRIDPNYSFDLCRLGCSLYDFIIDDDEQPEDFNDLQKVVRLWCTDDKNKNILYKKNGEERYPDFKLYKMIARTVHSHTPEAQLKLSFFSQFEISKKNVDITELINIDSFPTYVE